MKTIALPVAGLFATLIFSGCGVVEISFKAGFIMALILAAIIGLLIWIFHIGRTILTKYFPGIILPFEGFWDE
ncbi:MAG: hypothetical protein JWP78_2202 [Mucilaginibacter sp.]|nr:hypothetical protein [Mucilaginibacter sp.]